MECTYSVLCKKLLIWGRIISVDWLDQSSWPISLSPLSPYPSLFLALYLSLSLSFPLLSLSPLSLSSSPLLSISLYVLLHCAYYQIAKNGHTVARPQCPSFYLSIFFSLSYRYILSINMHKRHSLYLFLLFVSLSLFSMSFSQPLSLSRSLYLSFSISFSLPLSLSLFLSAAYLI